MDEKTIKAIATYVAVAATLKQSGVLGDLERHSDELVARVRSKVPPTKPDGSAWTDPDIVALLDRADENFDEAINRSKVDGE
jgi:hypothetical protein